MYATSPPHPTPPPQKKMEKTNYINKSIGTKRKIKICYPNNWVWINFILYNIPHSQGDVDSKGEQGIFLHE